MTADVQSKLIGETITVRFEFLDQMAFGETLSLPFVTVSLFSGVDYSPSAILSGTASVDGSAVEQKITDGMAGVVYVLTATATGSSGAVFNETLRLAILADEGSWSPASIPVLSGDLPDGIVGAAYSHALDIAGGYAPYSPVGIIANDPAWMGYTVVDNTLVCAGTPDEAAATTYNFSPEITDAALTHATSPQTVNITRITITGDLGDGAVGGSVNFQYVAANGTAPYTFNTAISGLPPGTSIDANGLVTGTYTTEGANSWVVEATDANGVPATLADSNNVIASKIYVAIDNTLTLLRSNDGGLSFTDTVATGLATSTSNVGVQVAGGKMFHLGVSNQGRVTDDGVNFSACSGLLSAPGSSNMIAVEDGSTEWLLGGIQYQTSSDGSAFADRPLALEGTGKLKYDGVNTVIGIVGGRFLNRSTDKGVSFTAYSVDPSLSSSEGIQFVWWTGTKWMLFANGPSSAAPALIIGTSATGASGTWTLVAGPEVGALTSVCHGVAQDPDTGRIAMVLKNGHTWYTDNEGTSWTAGPNLSYGGSTNYPPAQGNNMIFAAGAFLIGAAQGGSVNKIYRSPDAVTAWAEVYSSSAGNAINSMAAFP